MKYIMCVWHMQAKDGNGLNNYDLMIKHNFRVNIMQERVNECV